MKFPKLFKKAAALVMAAVTTFSVLPATTAFAAGDIGTISFDFTYDRNGNAMRYNSSAVFDGYTAGGTGSYKYRMYVDGDDAFCIQPGVPLKTGNTLKKNSSQTWNALSSSQKKAVGLALLYGYQGNRSHLSGSDDEKWLATQTLVWEFVTGCRESTGAYQQTSQKAYSLHFGSNYPNSGAAEVYNQIVSLLSKHNTIPSFMSGGADDITKELSYQDGKYTMTLTDNNGVLADYSFATSDSKVSVSKSGNKLTITSETAFDGSVRITATRSNVPTVSSSAKLIAYGDPSLQDVVTGVKNADAVKAYLNVETPTGTIALKKTSEDGVVADISFTIKGENFNKTVTTDENGNLTVEGLFPGTYTITEQSISHTPPLSRSPLREQIGFAHLRLELPPPCRFLLKHRGVDIIKGVGFGGKLIDTVTDGGQLPQDFVKLRVRLLAEPIAFDHRTEQGFFGISRLAHKFIEVFRFFLGHPEKDLDISFPHPPPTFCGRQVC